MTPPPLQGDVRSFWWVLLLLCSVAFAFQGSRGIWEPDEGRYTSAGINMHESGDWLVPTVDGRHPHLTKPPLTYWAIAASIALFGHNEWAARLPGALAFIGTGLFVFGLGRRLCPLKPWLPAVVWGLSFAPIIAANVVSTDTLLAFFETAAMFACVEAWARGKPTAHRWYMVMWLAWGLAFMTKGPPGLLPLLAVTIYLGFHDRARLRQMFALPGLALFAVVAFWWFALVIGQQPDRLQYFLGYEVYDRIFTATHARNAEWYGALEVYLPVLLVGTLPWSALALRAVGGVRTGVALLRQRLAARDDDWLLLAYWVGVPLLVFVVARSRLQLYVLPLFVPLALVMARPLARWPWLQGRNLARTCVLTAAIFIGFKGALAHWPIDRDARVIAGDVSRFLDPHDIDRIVFVGMRPFYGLNLYLDRKIEGVEIGEQRFAHSTYVHPEKLCVEIGRRERSAYAAKLHRAGLFTAAVAECGARAVPIGIVDADNSRVEFFVIDAGRGSAVRQPDGLH
jgi:4-amino-4-deoxy-L-arabinose transferase-like glycosyltransferase